MHENILFVTDSQKRNDIKIYNINLDKFIEEINLNPGFLILYEKKLNRVLYSQISKLSFYKENDSEIDIDKDNIFISFINDTPIVIEYFNELKEIEKDIFTDLISRSSIKIRMGTKQDIISTIDNFDYRFSRPYFIDVNRYFFYLDLIQKEILDYNNKSLTQTTLKDDLIGRLIQEDEIYYFSLTNFKLLQFDYAQLYFMNRTQTFFEQHEFTSQSLFYEFIPLFNSENQQKLSSLQIGEDYLVELAEESSEENSEYLLVKGNLDFGIISENIQEFYLRIYNSKKIKEKHNKLIRTIENALRTKTPLINVANDLNMDFIESQINNLIDPKINVTIFNVGQGNWIDVNFSDICNLVFDIGYGKHSNKAILKMVLQDAANRINSNSIIVLSHWDLDHIRGISYLNNSQFHIKWIVPELPPVVSFAALRLLLRLRANKKVKLSYVGNKLNNSEIYSGKHIRIGKGEGLDRGKVTVRNKIKYRTSYNTNNNIGLILIVQNANNTVLLPGDCEYIQFPNSFYQGYNHIVLSHHGAATKIKCLKTLGITLNTGPNSGKAVASVGNTTNYPSRSHKKLIKKLNFKLTRTNYYNVVSKPLTIMI